MKTHSRATPKPPGPAKSLHQVLGQSEHVKSLVEECAEELSSVNADLKQQFANGSPVPGVVSAIEKSEAIENKVQEASDKLSAVNHALEDEVKERHVLEHQLAAVTEEGEAARHAAVHDSLTGLPNRTLFNDRLELGLAQAKRHGRILAVMFLDLDDFKDINDSYGHDVGDSTLKTIAERLKNNMRAEDTVSRHGGDEFLYLLMEIHEAQDAALVAKKIIGLVRAPFEIRVRERIICPNIGASIGIAIYPQDGDTADILIKSADEAMYRAKRDKSGYSFAQ